MATAANKINLATAKIVPVFLALATVYISYAITRPLAIDYLLDPPKHIQPRIGAGIAIPIIYYILLIPVGATYLRLLHVVCNDPGYTALGLPGDGPNCETGSGLEDFWMRNVFVSDSHGMPIWCSFCNNWKPDRTRHSQDTGRCTRKFDHFCPWVGGVLGERSLKFFVQFNFYSFLLSAFAMSVLAYFVAEKKESSNIAVQWIIALGLSAFFCLFTLGIFLNSLWMTLRNATSVENINYHAQTTLLAILLPPEMQGEKMDNPPPPPKTHLSSDMSLKRSVDGDNPLTSDLNDPSHSSYFMNLQNPRPARRSSVLPYQDRIWRGTVTYPLSLQTNRPPLPAPPPKTFAILETLPGMNVWDLGSKFQNFKAVFGSSLHEWLLPIKHSPCCDHSSLVSQFPLGPDFEELLIEAGLTPRPLSSAPPRQPPVDATASSISTSRNRRKRPRLEAGWQNGERPDGWLSEKEARRLRNEARRATREGLG